MKVPDILSLTVSVNIYIFFKSTVHQLIISHPAVGMELGQKRPKRAKYTEETRNNSN